MTAQPPETDLLRVKIARKTYVTDDICLIDLVAADGGELPAFEAGAHIAVRTPAGGMREFSPANDPADRRRYQLGIKAERSGRGASASMVDDTAEGDEILVAPPTNDFPLVPADDYLFIAGGIGITPILSMVRQVAREGRARFRLVYCTRSAAATPFLDDLRAPDLKDHVTLHHDGGDPDRAFDFWDLFATPTKAQVYCCGPAALMEEVKGVAGHWPTGAVHFEDFHAGGDALRADDRPFTVTNARTGETFAVPADRTILEALRAAGQDLRSSCESGTCGTCKTRLVTGAPDHRDLVLTEPERAGHIMICVSRARSDTLVLEW